MTAAARLTIEVMRWLNTQVCKLSFHYAMKNALNNAMRFSSLLQEFNRFERCCAGASAWPHWHWPVILLYGGHLALNQLGLGRVIKSSVENGQLDYSTTAATNIREGKWLINVSYY